MTRLGIIARGDSSGLGNQTHEVWRHLQPARTLVIDLRDKNRGPFRPYRFADPERSETRIASNHHGAPLDDEIRWLVDGSDVVWCAETPTHPGLNHYCAETGTRLIIHANPELWDETYATPPAEVWTATAYREDLLPRDARLVPFPVATDRLATRAVTRVRRVLHVDAAAMLDRNGMDLVRAAVPHLRHPIELELPRHVEDYWDLYRDADALVLPRRYAGLCLTMQEAAACGLPIVMLETDPNAKRTIPELRVPITESWPHRMKGGLIDVYETSGALLATAIDALADPDVVTRAAAASRAWANEISWDRQLPHWRQLLDLPAEAVA